MDAGKVARTGLKRHVLMARLKNGLVVPGLLDSRRQQQVRFEEPEHIGHHSGARPLDASEQRDTLRFGRARGVRRTAPRHNARSQGNCRRRFRLIVAACDRSNSHSRTAGAPVGRCRSSQSWGSWRPRRRPSPAAGRGACWRRRRCLRCSCGGRAWLGTDGESSGPESRSCGGSAAVACWCRAVQFCLRGVPLLRNSRAGRGPPCFGFFSPSTPPGGRRHAARDGQAERCLMRRGEATRKLAPMRRAHASRRRPESRVTANRALVNCALTSLTQPRHMLGRTVIARALLAEICIHAALSSNQTGRGTGTRRRPGLTRRTWRIAPRGPAAAAAAGRRRSRSGVARGRFGRARSRALARLCVWRCAMPHTRMHARALALALAPRYSDMGHET